MVNLKTYFPHATVGPNQRLFLSLLKVGDGKYKKVQQDLIDFAGHVKVKGVIDDDFVVILKIIDDSNCTIGFPDPTNATYQAGPKNLVITIPGQATLKIYEGKRGTYIEGIPKVPAGTPWIGE